MWDPLVGMNDGNQKQGICIETGREYAPVYSKILKRLLFVPEL